MFCWSHVRCLRLRYLNSDPAWPLKEPRPDGSSVVAPCFRTHHRWILNHRSRFAVEDPPKVASRPRHRWIPNHSGASAVEDPPMTEECPQVRPPCAPPPGRGPFGGRAQTQPEQRSPRSSTSEAAQPQEDERPRSRRSSHGVDRGSGGQTPPPRSSPPSAVMVWPVSQAASSESRKPTTPAMSSGSPRRLSGYGAETSSSRPS